MRPSVRSGRTSMLALAAVLLAGCGGTPTAPSGGGTGGGKGSAALAKYVNMPDDQLLAAAKNEGSVVIYASNSSIQENAAAFQKQYGIKVQTYRADSEEVLQRVLQEAGAGKLPADLVDTNGGELLAMTAKSVLADYDNKRITGQLRPGSVHPGWVATRYDAFTVAWNSNKIKSPPASYQDLIDPRFKGQIELEPDDWDWYLGLHSYLTGQMHWTTQQADAFFTKLAANAKVVKGHTVQAQLLDSGQIGIAPDSYKHLIDQDHFGKGAPVVWQPVVQPVLYRPNGIGLTRTAPHPAAATLYMKWSLTDGQKLFPAQYRVPANLAVTTKNPIPAGTKVYDIPLDQMTNDSAKWSEAWQKLLQGAPTAGKG
ncbi:MAG: ABC transporter substrate-binding protein [Solirubrobacteraceae bacterium]